MLRSVRVVSVNRAVSVPRINPNSRGNGKLVRFLSTPRTSSFTGQTKLTPYLVGLLGFLGAAYFLSEDEEKAYAGNALPPPVDYKAVRKAIADQLEKDPNYDDGSFGPVLVRLAWHASGTYDKVTGTGGSNGATMRFPPESEHGANAGLAVARAFLEPIKSKFPGISYADLWTLAGAVAIESMGGPTIPWRPGRKDVDEKSANFPPNGRLPDASKGQDHVRAIFYRMGFNDQEIVALIGAHALGRCHTDRSGYSGPWTRSPTMFTNEYFRELKQNTWTKKKWNGPEQYEDPTGELMMLPADLALIKDPAFKKWVDVYAKNQDKFFEDFVVAFSKLLELGVPFAK